MSSRRIRVRLSKITSNDSSIYAAPMEWLAPLESGDYLAIRLDLLEKDGVSFHTKQLLLVPTGDIDNVILIGARHD